MGFPANLDSHWPIRNVCGWCIHRVQLRNGHADSIQCELTTLSSAEVSFVFSGGWGIGRGEIKRAGAGEKGNPSHRPPRAPDFSVSRFSFSFSRFLAISPLKEPLRRREC